MILSSAVLTSILSHIQDRVDINVYFVTNAAESDILSIKESLERLPEVERVEYMTREQALDNFRKKHENDELTLLALDELEDNPLGAVLNIKAKETSQYESIATYLSSDSVLSESGVPIVSKVNYYDNKAAIDSLTNIIASAEKIGFAVTLIVTILSIIITFNTIRLVIFVSRDEISVMRLVGASNKYIRGPFVVVGTMYGAIAGLLTLAVFYPLTYWLGNVTEGFLAGMNIFSYYLANFGQIFLLIVVSGMLVGALSSYLAVRRYLR
jgi:cell division transport system permease protein